MNPNFDISLEWLPYTAGSERDRLFSASIGITAGDTCLTYLDDLIGMTTREHMYGCAWQLAEWFAANWWRLRWESFLQSAPLDVSRAMSHCMVSAGGGFVWPNIIFDGDGDFVNVSVPCKIGPAESYASIRYLSDTNNKSIPIPANTFEQAVDRLLEATLSRGAGFEDKSLANLWHEVCDERRNPKVSRYRKWEAIAGYDPDEAPPALLKGIFEASKRYGRQSSEEVVADARHNTGNVFKAIQELPESETVDVSLPDGSIIDSRSVNKASVLQMPWQRGKHAAELARRALGIPADRPVSDKKLAEVLGVSSKILNSTKGVQGEVLPFALRKNGTGGTYRLHLKKTFNTSRRFEICRLLGDCLLWGENQLHPATESGTARQKTQRAFAAEFLCPSDALWDQLGCDISPDNIAKAAKHFNVSEWTINTFLVNNEKLDRDIFSQRVG